MSPVARKILAVLAVCLVFALGMATGAAVTFRIVWHRAAALLTERGSDQATDRLARRVADKLNADAAQRQRIDDALHQAHAETREIRHEVAPRVHEIYRRAVREIRASLRPDQVETFDEMMTKWTDHLHLAEGNSPVATPQPVATPSPPTGTASPQPVAAPSPPAGTATPPVP